MKNLLSVKPWAGALLALSAFLVALPAYAENHKLAAAFTDPAWNGKKIPKGQQCQKFGGVNPMTPELKITGIPQNTQAMLLRFNDENFQKMNNGGHGIIGMLVEPGTTEMVFPSVPGHTFELPDGIFMVRAHKSPGWDKAGAYMPPCSGGQRNKYSVTIQPSTIKNLEKKKFKKIARIKVTMGRY